MTRLLITMLSIGVLLCWVAVPDAQAQCSICQSCTDSGQCALGEECAQFEGVGGRCVADCSLFPCPGDSECWNVTSNDGSTVQLCLNPDADVSLCPASYTCSGGNIGGGCPALGLDCSISAQICGPLGGDYCIDTGNGAFCSCNCASAADCGAGAACVEVQPGTRACIPGASGGNCDGVMCNVGEVCDPNSGACVPEGGGNLCDTVTCTPPAVCSPATGTCIGGTMDVPPMDMPPMDMGPSDTVISTDVSQPDANTSDTQMDTALPPDSGMMQNTLEAEGECGCVVRRAEREGPWGPLLVALSLVLGVVAPRVRRR